MHDSRGEEKRGLCVGLCVYYPSFVVWDLRSRTEVMRTADGGTEVAAGGTLPASSKLIK